MVFPALLAGTKIQVWWSDLAGLQPDDDARRQFQFADLADGRHALRWIGSGMGEVCDQAGFEPLYQPRKFGDAQQSDKAQHEDRNQCARPGLEAKPPRTQHPERPQDQGRLPA